MPRLLWLEGREPRPDAMINPSMAQHHLWMGQAQHDRGMLSARELAKIEAAAGMIARHSRTMFNPFTGEIRKVDPDDRPTTVFLGGIR